MQSDYKSFRSIWDERHKISIKEIEIQNREVNCEMDAYLWNHRFTKTSKYSVTNLCNLFDVTKQVYYQYHSTVMERLSKEHFIIEFVKNIRQVLINSISHS